MTASKRRRVDNIPSVLREDFLRLGEDMVFEFKEGELLCSGATAVMTYVGGCVRAAGWRTTAW